MSVKERATLTFCIWLCVYPSVLFFSYAFGWLGLEVPLWAEIGISTAISVPLISTVATPLIEKAIARAEGQSPAELKLRQARAADGPSPEKQL